MKAKCCRDAFFCADRQLDVVFRVCVCVCVFGYGPTEAKGFSSNLCVQTGSEAHPASCTMGTGGPFPGGKAHPGRDADHSAPSSAEVENE
jgi:hypothetical protein